MDVDSGVTGAVVIGVNVSAPSWNSSPTYSAGYTLNPPGGSSGAVWGVAYNSQDGATGQVLRAGTETLSTNSASQSIVLYSRILGIDTGSTIQALATGEMDLTPVSGQAVKINGNFTISGNMISAGETSALYYDASVSPAWINSATFGTRFTPASDGGSSRELFGTNAANNVTNWYIGDGGLATFSAYANANGTVIPATATTYKGTSTGGPVLALTGTTGTITGTSLSSTCDSGTATVSGAITGHPVAVSSTTGADVGGAFNLRASVTATNTVTVYVCGTGTPASLAYTVTVF
jgi:hypothetical protein